MKALLLIKKFFSIEEKFYRFEIFDVTSILIIINVVLIILGIRFASIFGLASCIICFGMNIKTKAHINSYITQIALIVLNTYFLF